MRGVEDRFDPRPEPVAAGARGAHQPPFGAGAADAQNRLCIGLAAPALREDGAGQQVGQFTLERLPFEVRLVAKLDAEQRAYDPFTTLAPSARGFTEQRRDLGPHHIGPIGLGDASTLPHEPSLLRVGLHRVVRHALPEAPSPVVLRLQHRPRGACLLEQAGQGAGQALWEHVAYDASSGQLLTGSLMDYALPRADQFPPMHASFDESVPCKTNLLGVKGVGELGTIGATPAAVLAVLDALAERGVQHLEMPITPEKIWRALGARN